MIENKYGVFADKFAVIEHPELTMFEKLETFGIELLEFQLIKYPAVVVAFSGGKDSQACLRIACDNYGSENVLAEFSDTKNEHPLTYKHVDKIVSDYGCSFASYTAGSVLGEIEKAKRFPTNGARFCTSYLKLRPSKYFEVCLSAEHENKGFTVYVGIRGDEGAARTKRYKDFTSYETMTRKEMMPSVFPDYMHERYNIMVQLPLLDSSLGDVKHLLGDTVNPLYETFDRCGCFPCVASGDGEKIKAFGYDEFGKSQEAKFRDVAIKINRPLFTGKKTEHLNTACSFCVM